MKAHFWLQAFAGCTIAIAVIYTAGYYYVTDEWPWQQEQNVAAQILQESGGASAMTLPETPGVSLIAKPALQTAQLAHQSAVLSAHGFIPNLTSAPTLQPTSAPAVSAIGPQHITIQQGTLQQGTVHSTFMGLDLPYLVYLPAGYDAAENAQRRYPVAYLLHGAPGNYKDWSTVGKAPAIADALIATGHIPPMILVMPEGVCSLTKDSEWANGNQVGLQAESYLVQELVPFIDAHYRTIAKPIDRAIGGLSTGGFGGVNTTLHHPDIFGSAFGISGNYVATKTILQQTIFTSPTSIGYNSPIAYLATMKNPQQLHIFLAVGKNDKLDNTLQETKQMEQALITNHVPHVVEYDNGAHSWSFWSSHLVDALTYFASVLSTN